jgi:hypothetical protein
VKIKQFGNFEEFLSQNKNIEDNILSILFSICKQETDIGKKYNFENLDNLMNTYNQKFNKKNNILKKAFQMKSDIQKKINKLKIYNEDKIEQLLEKLNQI